MRNTSLIAASLSLVFSGNVFSKNLGAIGELWPVKEKNMITYLEEKAKEKDIDELKNTMRKNAKKAMNEPEALNLPLAVKTIHKEYVPMAIAEQDVVDAYGRVIIARGTSVNVLANMPYFMTKLLFIDGREKNHYKWVKINLKSYPAAKVILTAGKVSDCESQLNRACYFDQQAKITQKLGITHVPAFVQKHDLSLDVAEIYIDGDGNAIK